MTANKCEYWDNLSFEAQARYLCLMEGIGYIFNQLEDIGKKENFLDGILGGAKANTALNKYIKERFPAMAEDLKAGIVPDFLEAQ